MSVFIISYELNFAGQRLARAKKSGFESFIGSFQKSLQMTDNLVLISTDKKIEELSNEIEKIVEDSDHIFISEITENYCGVLSDEVWNWLDGEFFMKE